MKRALQFIAVLLVAFSALAATSRFVPRAEGMQDSYLNGYINAREALKRTQDAPRRVLLMSGSSLGWSVSAQELTEQLGMPVVNLGVQASMGYDNIWRYFEPLIRKDKDIVVFSAAYKMMYGRRGTTDTYCDVLFLEGRNAEFNLPCMLASADRVAKNLVYIGTGKSGADGDYQSQGWNEYGDYTLHLDQQNRAFDSTDDSAVSTVLHGELPKGFIRFFNKKQAMGYKLVYLPPSIPESSCRDRQQEYSNANEQIAQSFGVYFDERFPFCVADNLFFNTHYHMNKEGRALKTRATQGVINRYLGTHQVAMEAH